MPHEQISTDSESPIRSLRTIGAIRPSQLTICQLYDLDLVWILCETGLFLHRKSPGDTVTCRVSVATGIQTNLWERDVSPIHATRIVFSTVTARAVICGTWPRR